jgi:hypothetical protein
MQQRGDCEPASLEYAWSGHLGVATASHRERAT